MNVLVQMEFEHLLWCCSHISYYVTGTPVNLLLRKMQTNYYWEEFFFFLGMLTPNQNILKILFIISFCFKENATQIYFNWKHSYQKCYPQNTLIKIKSVIHQERLFIFTIINIQLNFHFNKFLSYNRLHLLR